MKHVELSTFTTNTIGMIAFRVKLSPQNKRTKTQKALNENDFEHIESFIGKSDVEIQNRHQCDFIIEGLSQKLKSHWASNHAKKNYSKDIETIKNLIKTVFSN